jgi:hypothetical protein
LQYNIAFISFYILSYLQPEVETNKMLRLLTSALALSAAAAYQLGAGIYDMTGPSVEINFMVSIHLIVVVLEYLYDIIINI